MKKKYEDYYKNLGACHCGGARDIDYKSFRHRKTVRCKIRGDVVENCKYTVYLLLVAVFIDFQKS